MQLVTDEQAHDLVKLIRYKVWACTQGQPPGDLDDLVQDVVLRVLEQLPQFDQSKASLLTYQNRLIERACADCQRRARAAKRGGQCTIRSLDDSRPGHRVLATIGAEQLEIVRGKRNRPETVLRDLKLDIESASNCLETREQRLCDQIKRKPVAEVARDEKVVRGTIYRRLRPVREAFESLGLAEYLD